MTRDTTRDREGTANTFVLRRLRVGHQSVAVTRAYDTYWRFAYERQAMFFRRVAGEGPPWTNDPILAVHRFTNVYRASDRVSQYLIRHVIYTGEQTAEEVFFRTVLFKLFNRIGTWEDLQRRVAGISWKEYHFEQYSGALDALLEGGDRVYSAAYIMPAPPFGELRKHANHLRLIEHMMRDSAPQKIAAAGSLRAVFELLRGYPSLGDFLAFQLAIDLNYGPLVAFSEMDFIVAGPGARDGIRKCFPDAARLGEERIIRLVAETADEEFGRLGLGFQSLWGRPLQLIDCQNVFCELGKYARVAHPDIGGTSNRTRIKQKYTPALTPIPQWYPPKWGINQPILTARGPTSCREVGPRKSAPVQQSFDEQSLRPISSR